MERLTMTDTDDLRANAYHGPDDGCDECDLKHWAADRIDWLEYQCERIQRDHDYERERMVTCADRIAELEATEARWRRIVEGYERERDR